MEAVILTNWDEEHPLIKSDDLGWSHSAERDAESTDSKEIFEYYIGCGFNIRLYDTFDGEFYCFFQENLPLEVKRIPKNTAVSSAFITDMVPDDSHAEGEIIAVCEDISNAWESILINGRHVKDVISTSIIISID